MSQFEPRSCRTVEPALDRFAAGSLAEEEESAVREHLTACTSCRTRAAGRDPSILFLELRGRPLPASFWAGYPERLRAALAPARFRWSDLFRYPRLAYLTAPAAMVLIVAVSLFLAHPGRPHMPGRDARPLPGPAIGGEVSGQIAGVLVTGDAAAGLVPPVLEEVGSPGARVYRFEMGEGSDPTPIFLVVDESIDI